MPRILSLLPALAACLLLALAAGSARSETLDDAAWKKARKDARRLMKQPGQRFTKQRVIGALGMDDSRRATELMVQWTLRSLRLQQGELTKELAKRKEKLDKLEKILRKAYDKFPPPTMRVDDKRTWDLVKGAYREVFDQYEAENGVRYSLGEAFRTVRDPAAVTYLIDEGLPAVQKAKGSEEAQVAIAKCLVEQPKARVLALLLAMAVDAKRVKLRMLALHWIGQNKHAEGFDALVQGLGAKEVAVRRIAVHGMQQLDDKRGVKALIDSMAKADGLLNAEIDDVLHWFTGKSFEGSAAVWKRWWKNEGAAWLAAADEGERHERKREALPGGTRVRFYGIPTESKHIVFVLDRSGSMKNKASDKSIAEKKKKPKGPVTGGDGKGHGKGKGREAIAGDTKMEVAKNQLALSIKQLDRKVKFGVVFYSDNVKVWREPPELLDASKPNKASSTEWFTKLEAQGPTLMFPALMKALEYADTVGQDKKKQRTGANTIFLLSDGSPTTAGGQVLPAAELEQAIAEFLEANKLYRCVVHTIGIGPGHNSSILRRIAAATGGQYKAVGTN
ncbi:MAG: VWA domain-containing protein [Planctomycetota bacterium]|nr:VWA domain-containing protein [Planctomycetota bacterium]